VVWSGALALGEPLADADDVLAVVWAAAGSDDAAVGCEDGLFDGLFVGLFVGFDDGFDDGFVLGADVLGAGLGALVCAVAGTPGAVLPPLCQANATYPPSGMVSDPAPTEE
jgi:hypothetical protein